MIRTNLVAIAALAITASVGIAALLAQPGAVETQSHSANRSFPADWSAPGGEVQITITTGNLGGFGQVEETLPEGFTFVRSSLDAFQVRSDRADRAFHPHRRRQLYLCSHRSRHGGPIHLLRHRQERRQRRASNWGPCVAASWSGAYPYVGADGYSRTHANAGTHAGADVDFYAGTRVDSDSYTGAHAYATSGADTHTGASCNHGAHACAYTGTANGYANTGTANGYTNTGTARGRRRIPDVAGRWDRNPGSSDWRRWRLSYQAQNVV